MSNRKLTPKQKKFVEAYAGNATEAAKVAGYSGNKNTIRVTAHENLTKPNISKAIRDRQDTELKPIIANRQRRQELWTGIMEDENEKLHERLRASELLGKSEGDFVQKIEHSGNISFSVLTDEELDKEIQELTDKLLSR